MSSFLNKADNLFFKKTLQIIIVYGAFLLRAFSFLLLAPLFVRVISPNIWGGIISAQALAIWLTLVLEFGFALSYARLVSMNMDAREKVRSLFGEVMSAKLILIPICGILAYFFTFFGVLKDFYFVSFLALLLACAQGLSPLWYFQAVEKLHIFSLVDICVRIVYLLAASILVRSNDSAYLVIGLLFLCTLSGTIITLLLAWRDMGGWNLSFKSGLIAIKSGFTLSSFTLVTSIYASASVFIFSLFAPSIIVAVYGNADRLVRAGISVMGPLNQLILPRSAKAFGRSKDEGFGLAKKLLIGYGGLGLLIFILGIFLSPIVVKLMYGERYFGSIFFMRWLLVLFPLVAINTVIAYHILIPLGNSSQMTTTYIVVSVVALILIFILVPLFSGSGMLIAMIVPEFLALLGMLFILWRSQRYG